MMINELIDQIGGRERLEAFSAGHYCSVFECRNMARALLAVLDAKPVGVTISPTIAAMDGVSQVGIEVYPSPPAASALEGYKLVPIEPSKEMLLASKRYKAKNKVPTGPGVYRAMIAAAPAPAPGGE